MKCPHCLHDVFVGTAVTSISTYGTPRLKHGHLAGEKAELRTSVHTCPKCAGAVVDLSFKDVNSSLIYETFRVYPRGGPFPPAPAEVPASISLDYAEANEVLPISAKAAAALARRCLQAVLAAHGYKSKDLVKQVESALSETDTTKALPTALRENIDAIRNFGNFSAHPITDQTTLQVVEVEVGEAEWCLQLLLDMFDAYYVAPARAAERRAALAQKLAAAGKPPMKQAAAQTVEAEEVPE